MRKYDSKPGTWYVLFFDYDEGRAQGIANPFGEVIANDFPDEKSAQEWMDKEEIDPKYKGRWVAFNVHYELTDAQVAHYKALDNLKYELSKEWRDIILLIQNSKDARAKGLYEKISAYLKDLILESGG